MKERVKGWGAFIGTPHLVVVLSLGVVHPQMTRCWVCHNNKIVVLTTDPRRNLNPQFRRAHQEAHGHEPPIHAPPP